jgi:hypothetical protein
VCGTHILSNSNFRVDEVSQFFVYLQTEKLEGVDPNIHHTTRGYVILAPPNRTPDDVIFFDDFFVQF